MEIRTLHASELELAWTLDANAFHVAPEKREAFLQLSDPERMVGAFDGARLVALTQAHGFGQFFGGRAVPMGGVASVAVVPDWRGRGLAKQVVSHCLQVARGHGDAIASLFPATTSLYRALGFEMGGHYVIRKVPAAGLHGIPAPEEGRLRPVAESGADREALRACYARVAQSANGCLDRPAPWWERRLRGWQGREAFAFEGRGGQIDGYVVYGQAPGAWTALGGPRNVSVDEIVAATRDAARALWRMLGSWSSQVESLFYHGAAEDPLLLVLPEQNVLQTLADIRWMTRVLDAEAAVAARGFPAGLELEVPLRLRDPLLHDNEGSFVLHVAKGRGALVRDRAGRHHAASDAGPVIGIRGFSSLYTGWASTASLLRAGLLEGGSDDERARLDAAFGGPVPYVLEEF